MKTFVINLKRRPDRREHMEKVLPAELLAEYTTDWEGPLDGKHITAASLKGYGLFPWQIASGNIWWSRPLKNGEIGCSISHWMCWQRAQRSNDDIFLIFEDDVILDDGFLSRLDQGLDMLDKFAPEWDMVYLGRFQLEPDSPAFKGFLRPGYSHCTFGYMLTKQAVGKLIQTSFDQAIIPVDEFLPAMYIDHPREDVRRRYPRQLSAYAFDPPIVSQLPKALAGSDTEDSEFHERA